MSKAKSVVGIEFGNSYASFAVKKFNGPVQVITALEPDTEQASEPDWAELVKSFVTKHKLQAYDCNVVLPANEYQLMLVERPDVPEEELRQAIKWRVKDLISSSIDSVVIDTFALPADAIKAGKSMLYVVVVELSRIKAIIDFIENSGLRLKHIDIEILALRNLTLLKDIQRGAAIVRLRPNSGDVSIYRDGNLYLSRHFKLPFNAGLLDDIPEEELLLEIQRSFDYVERQMGQAPPGVLFLTGEGVGPEKISDSLRQSLSCSVEYLELSQEIAYEKAEIDDSIIQLCMGAIGAVYREGYA